MTKLLTPSGLLNIGLIIFIIILFFWKPCNKDAEYNAKLEAENTGLKKEILRLDDTLMFLVRNHYEDVKRWQGLKDLYETEKREADNNQRIQQRTIDRLASIVRVNTGKPIDSSFVLVSPDYKEACDSLPAEIDKLNRTIAEKDTAIDAWTDILAYEVQQRDSTIDALSTQIGRVMLLNQQQNKIAEDALKSAKRRGMFLVGAGNLFLPGDNFNPHIAAAYQNKDGKQFQGKVGIVNGKQYYEGTALIPLFK